MEVGGELERVCADLNLAIGELQREGFRLDLIYPADDPHSAVLSGPDGQVRLTTRPGAPRPTADLPPFEPEFLLSTAGDEGGEGRAGMLYRDLIPSRLGGRYVASLIRIPVGGPVADWVHYHRVGFQMIAVRAGWVRVVYEDQGPSFVMQAGDMVLQPPGIRHRVLESSDGLEVIEIGCPALHETLADHDLELPNEGLDPQRLFDGQRFLRHVAAETKWTAFAAGEAQETAMRDASGGRAEVRIIRPRGAEPIDVPPHNGELVFGFTLGGTAGLIFGGNFPIGPGDAFVIPPGEAWTLAGASPNFRLLHVTTGRLGQFA